MRARRAEGFTFAAMLSVSTLATTADVASLRAAMAMSLVLLDVLQKK